jgi:zinc D-Ala-D-Ala carboxypeptidase
MGDLTENFSSSEFECQCAEDCVAKNPTMQMDADFMKKLQTLREVYGGSLTVTSGVRCEKHNESIGGKPGSAHLSAVAADIKCDSSMQRYKLLSTALMLFDRVGIHSKFLHVDSAKGKAQTVCWVY